jgi:hypothetical protein
MMENAWAKNNEDKLSCIYIKLQSLFIYITCVWDKLTQVYEYGHMVMWLDNYTKVKSLIKITAHGKIVW